MARSKYRLEALLTIRENEKKRAESALAAAIKALKEAKEKEKKLIREKKDIIEKWQVSRAEMSASMTAGSSIFDGTVHTNFLRKLKEDEEAKEKEIVKQGMVVAEATEGVARARRDYIDAAKELKVMKKHKELWQKKIEKEINRKEERELNDLTNTIHNLRKWRGEETGL